MDVKDYLDMVQAAHARLRAAALNTDEYDDLELFVYTLGRLRSSWRDRTLGRGAPHLFFTKSIQVSTNGSEATVARVWPDICLDDRVAATAAFTDGIVKFDECAQRPAACCGESRAVICSLDSRGMTAPQSLPIECVSTLCHTCYLMRPIKP